jgi:membrane-bound lytic murein transglycosylase D
LLNCRPLGTFARHETMMPSCFQSCLSRGAGAWLGLAAVLLAACSTPPAVESDPAAALDAPGTEAELDSMAYAAVDTVAAADEEEAPDETLLAKILRSHPELEEIDHLYVEGGHQYFRRELDAAEDNFLLLKEKVEQAKEAQPDSLALLYLDSMERKLASFVDILAEERFFSDSYAPRELTLTEAYETLRAETAIPDFLLPSPAETASAFERELLMVDNPQVDAWIDYFTTRGRDAYQTWLDQRARVGYVVAQILDDEELPPELIYLAMIESGLKPSAHSRASAVGYWQFVRSTARLRGLVVDDWVDERRDLEKSTRAACRYLKLLHGMFGNWPLALAGYNAGEYRIQRAIGLQGDPDFWDLRLPRETREYVPKFIAAARIGMHAEDYGFELPPDDPLLFDEVQLDDAFSLDQISQATGISESSLRELNPQLVAFCTPPTVKPYSLRVPEGQGDATAAAVAKIPDDQRITWRKHRVRSGETLGQIARRYHTSVSGIMDLNGITDARRVRAGRVLTIPYPRGMDPGDGVVMAAATAQDEHPNAVRHKVDKGDTLVSLSRRYGTSVRALRSLNGLHSDRIYEGQVLVVHAGMEPATLVSETSHVRTQYTVRSGDTVSDIGRRFGVSVRDLLGWNDLPASGSIHPGDVLSIWKPRTP